MGSSFSGHGAHGIEKAQLDGSRCARHALQLAKSPVVLTSAVLHLDLGLDHLIGLVL